MKSKNVKLVTGITIIFLLIVAVYNLFNPTAGVDIDYGLLFDGIWFTIIISFLYWKYESFNQNLLSYSLLLSLIVFHVIGVMFFFGKSLGLIQFDMIIHTYGGFVLAVFFYRYINFKPKLYDNLKLRLAAFVILSVLGLSALHEVMEFLGYGLLGEGTGLFMYGLGDFGAYNDAMIDLMSNLDV